MSHRPAHPTSRGPLQSFRARLVEDVVETGDAPAVVGDLATDLLRHIGLEGLLWTLAVEAALTAGAEGEGVAPFRRIPTDAQKKCAA